MKAFYVYMMSNRSRVVLDRKSTRLNSSHSQISYAVFCLKKKIAELSGVSLDIAQGERFGLIGPNGSGKTPLINCLSAALRNVLGNIVLERHEISRLTAP